MKREFAGWHEVVTILQARASDASELLNEGQRRTIAALTERLLEHGVLIADEVGMGKTRIAATVASAVIEAGGRVAILIPPGLGAQWKKELEDCGCGNIPDTLRSLDGFLRPWSNETAKPWWHEPALMISHVLANWRLGEESHTWRWGLLPCAWIALQEKNGERAPWKSKNVFGDSADELRVKRAARAIVEARKKEIGDAAYSRLRREILTNEGDRKFDWKEARRPDSYAKDDQCRGKLEQLVGVGLGTFDLVILDEAHKNRPEESGLSRLLERMVVQAPNARRLALTATPVELDVKQWKETLKRLKTGVNISEVQRICDQYARAVHTLQETWHVSEPNRIQFGIAAAAFEVALRPYVLRRGKREDPDVCRFVAETEENFAAYRRETPIEVKLEDLSPQWMDAVFAAEALSTFKRSDLGSGEIAKRLRLTIGNGHGIAAMLDTPWMSTDEENEDQDKVEPIGQGAASLSDLATTRRIEFWWNTLSRLSGGGTAASFPLVAHPAIRAAVETIERLTEEGRKVLVFGRFTEPLRHLESLLNVRAMLRYLHSDRDWPQRQVATEDEFLVAEMIGEMNLPGLSSLIEVNERLAKGYDEYEKRRRRQVEFVRMELKGHRFHGKTIDDFVTAEWLPRAVLEYLGNIDKATEEMIRDATDEVLASLEDRGAERVATNSSRPIWVEKINQRLRENYQAPRGGFARLMYGETKQETRTNLQLKFNRQGCFPDVLIAQSQVGREGLNLHKQCRDVILLHPEWNPAVVEQQLGRVDRLGSQWSKDFNNWCANPEGDVPRIEIRPVIFKGTYDEQNWAVLRKRWAELRAQLHGIILTEEEIGDSLHDKQLAKELNDVTPNFSPGVALSK